MVGKTLNVRARGERLERATAIRAFALRLIQEKGQWQIVNGRLEIETKIFEDDRFLIMFYVMPPVPIEREPRNSQLLLIAERGRFVLHDQLRSHNATRDPRECRLSAKALIYCGFTT